MSELVTTGLSHFPNEFRVELPRGFPDGRYATGKC